MNRLVKFVLWYLEAIKLPPKPPYPGNLLKEAAEAGGTLYFDEGDPIDDCDQYRDALEKGLIESSLAGSWSSITCSLTLTARGRALMGLQPIDMPAFEPWLENRGQINEVGGA